MMKKYFVLAIATMLFATSFAQTNNYRLRVHKKNRTVEGISLSEVDSISFKKKQPTNPTPFTIEVSDLTASNGKYTITPEDQTMSYYQFLVSEVSYNTILDEYGSLIKHDQEWCQFLASQVGGTTWQDGMKAFLKTGTNTFETSAIIGNLKPASKYKIYCYGVDPNTCQAITDVLIYDFTTPTATQSDNVITVSNITPKNNAVDVTITTTNNDQYFVSAQTKENMTRWIEREGSLEGAVSNVIDILTNYGGGLQNNLFRGSQTITMTASEADTDYVLIVCGYDNGFSTAIQTFDFHTTK